MSWSLPWNKSASVTVLLSAFLEAVFFVDLDHWQRAAGLVHGVAGGGELLFLDEELFARRDPIVARYDLFVRECWGWSETYFVVNCCGRHGCSDDIGICTV